MVRSKKKKYLKLIKDSKFILAVFLTVVTLALLAQALFIARANSRIERLEAENLKTYIISAAQGLDSPFAVDPTTGRQYIPKSRLVFPAQFEGLVVRYYEGDGASLVFKDMANVQSAISNMNSAGSVEGIFTEVKVFQSCSRQIEMRYDTREDEDVKLVATKALKDGRIANFYQEAKCPHDASRLVGYLRLVDSF